MNRRIFLEGVLCAVGALILFYVCRPHLAAFYNNRGTVFFEQGDFDTALRYFRRSLRMNDSVQTHWNLANAYKEKNAFPEAIRHYRKVIDLDRNHTESYIALIHLHLARNDYTSARLVAAELENIQWKLGQQRSKEINSMNSLFLYNSAVTLLMNKRFDEAESVMADAESHGGIPVEGYKTIAGIYRLNGRYTEALKYYHAAVSGGLRDAQAYNDMGMCYMRLEQYRKALPYLEQAYMQEPSNLSFLYNLASTLRDSGQLTKALTYYRKIVQMEFGYPNIHNDIADVYLEQGRFKMARNEFQNEIRILTAGDSRAKEGDELLRLARAHIGLKEFRQAESILNSLIQRDPRDAEALFLRARLYENLGRFAEAKRDLLAAKPLYPKAAFIDDFLRHIEQRSNDAGAAAIKTELTYDTQIQLKNGRTITGKFHKETDDTIILLMNFGSSVGSITIKKQDVISRETLP